MPLLYNTLLVSLLVCATAAVYCAARASWCCPAVAVAAAGVGTSASGDIAVDTAVGVVVVAAVVPLLHDCIECCSAAPAGCCICYIILKEVYDTVSVYERGNRIFRGDYD